MPGFHHQPLPEASALLAGRHPPSDSAFQSERIHIWYNHSDRPWRDATPHAHVESDECFIVLHGSIEVEVEGQRITIGPREYCCFARGVIHAVVAVHPPVETLMIRAPSIEDKIYPTSLPTTS